MSGSKQDIRVPEPRTSEEKFTGHRDLQRDVYHELTDLNRQVRMISDSLAACKQMSKRRQMNARRPVDLSQRPHITSVGADTNEAIAYECVPEPPAHILLPVQEPNVALSPKKDTKNTIVSYMMPDRSALDHLNKAAGLSRSPGPFPTDFPLGPVDSDSHVDLHVSMSHIKLYEFDRVDSFRLLDVILRELTLLEDLVPSAALRVSEIARTMAHYRVCSRCIRKFHEFLPRILNRVQELIKHVTKKRGEFYVWPNDLSYLRLSPRQSDVCLIEEEETEVAAANSDSVQLARLEKLDVSVLDDAPGVQLLLLVEPEKARKRTYEAVARENVAEELDRDEVFPIFHLRELVYNHVVTVLRPCHWAPARWERRQGVVRAKSFAPVVGLNCVAPNRRVLAAAVQTPVIFAAKFETAKFEFYPRGVVAREERTLVLKSNLLNIFVQHLGRVHGLCQNDCSDSVVRFRSTEKIDANAQKLTEVLLADRKGPEMHLQKMTKDLEVEVKDLKDLVLEVHRNQVELSKVLVEKGVSCSPIVKLTDPSMLDEENQAVRKVTQLEVPNRRSSATSLQVAVDELKKKCAIKNRMIVTLLKGLKSNVPKEWWEDLVDCIFNDSKPIEEFDSEKVNEFIRQTSLYLMNRETASNTKLTSAPIQDPLSEDFKPDSDFPVSNESEQESSTRRLGLTEAISKCRIQLAKRTEKLMDTPDPKYTSSFIQNILQEDSQTGLAVVDLFVALKRAKDKLNLLTKVNNETHRKMSALKREVGTMKTDYRDLVGNVNDFFDKMNDAAKHWIMNLPETRAFHPVTKRPTGDQVKSQGPTPEKASSQDNENCPRENATNCNAPEKSLSGKEEPTVRIINMSPEDVLTTLIVNSLRKKRSLGQSDKSTGITDGTSQNGGNLKLSEANVQLICDICEVLSIASPGGESAASTSKGSQTKQCTEEECGEDCQVNGLFVGAGICSKKLIDRGKEIGRNLLGLKKGCRDAVGRSLDGEENGSEEDSLFEEALSEPTAEVAQKSSVSCMGDLTNRANKKSVSTLTTNTDAETSWIAKLTEDVKSKLRNLKPNFKRQVVLPENGEKSPKSLEGLEFTVSTTTPTGVFGVTVRQFKQFRTKAEKDSNSAQESSATTQVQGPHSKVKGVEQTWSDDSFHLSDSDRLSHVESTSGTGEDEMEEFVEVFVQTEMSDRRHSKQDKESPVALEKGKMLKTTLKQDKAPIFEIVKCQPRNFVQEILPKKSWRTMDGNVVATILKGRPKIDKLTRGESPVLPEASDDLIIYIQVEVDEEDYDEDSKKIYIECKSSTEDLPISIQRATCKSERKSSICDSLDLNRCCSTDSVNSDENFERIQKKNGTGGCRRQPTRKGNETEISNEAIVVVKEPQKKSVTFLDERNEIMQEKLISEILPEEEEGDEDEVDDDDDDDTEDTGTAGKIEHHQQQQKESQKNPKEWRTPLFFEFFNNCLKAHSYDMPRPYGHILRFDPKEGIRCVLQGYVDTETPELERALTLIHEIENNIVGVKLSDAILILPTLEAELRKHLQKKMRQISDRDQSLEGSAQDFFSALDFWPENEPGAEDLIESEESLHNLFALLSNLEDAVKGKMESYSDAQLCDQNSSRIYKLLQALTQSIKDLEERANVTNLAETLDIASQLDTAVREYDGLVRKLSNEREAPQRATAMVHDDSSGLQLSVKEHMGNVRRNVFQAVEGEAIKIEGRIERDFDRIERLERENEEAMNFVEAFLQKMTRRTAELEQAKKELKSLSMTLDELYMAKMKQIERNVQKRSNQADCTAEGAKVEPETQEPVRNTISGLLMALNKLKARAREKNDACREIFVGVPREPSFRVLDKKTSRCSRSSYTSRTEDDLFCVIKDFRRIGPTSLYMAWSKPDGSLSGLVVGYEIIVNDKLNQKVRNPRRTQAVLYSIDLKQKAEIQLYGVVESRSKILLASVTHYGT